MIKFIGKFNIDLERLLHYRKNVDSKLLSQKGGFSLSKPLVLPINYRTADAKGIFQDASHFDRFLDFIGNTDINPEDTFIISKFKEGGYTKPNFRRDKTFEHLYKKLRKSGKNIPKSPHDDYFSAMAHDLFARRIPEISGGIVENVPTVVKSVDDKNLMQVLDLYPDAILNLDMDLMNVSPLYNEVQPFLPKSFRYRGQRFIPVNYSLFLKHKDNANMNRLDLNNANYRSSEDKSKLLSFDPTILTAQAIDNLYK